MGESKRTRRMQATVVAASIAIALFASLARVQAGYDKRLRAGLPALTPEKSQQTTVAAVE
jgi:hypothetical protein